jgi:hypothetical protein
VARCAALAGVVGSASVEQRGDDSMPNHTVSSSGPHCAALCEDSGIYAHALVWPFLMQRQVRLYVC